MSTNTQPLVSVGIPTYNRPEGLLRTIQHIVAQRWQRLEIIVSNNASTQPLVAAVADRCAALDARIRVIHQPHNIGLVANFKTVLRQARGDYFMWAADDDEWTPHFVERCMAVHAEREVGTVMTGFIRRNRARGVEGVANLPKMDGADRFADALAFYSAMPHSIFYGVHRRSTLQWYLDDDDAANDDELLILRQILEHGVVTLPEALDYVAGNDDPGYVIKLPQEAPDRHFHQLPRLLRFAQLFGSTPALTDVQRLMLLQRALLHRMHFVLQFEQNLRRAEQLETTRALAEFLAELDFRNLPAFTAVIRQAKAMAVAQAQAQPAQGA
jgi:glycosyltransferase involved in cell wall biosynthesis